jgi:hypothetical protein
LERLTRWQTETHEDAVRHASFRCASSFGIAVTRGFASLNLWVIDANERARTFYENRGWSFVTDSEVYRPAQGITEVRYTVPLP